MTKAKCDRFGNCPLADGATHEIDENHVCALRQETGECGLTEVVGGRMKAPAWLGRVGIIGAVVVAVLALGYGGYRLLFSTQRCEVSEVSALLRTDPKLREMEDAGIGCLAAGRRRGDSEQLVIGTVALRTAADKGSATASYELGRLFDPLERPGLESDSKLPQLLPAIDQELALNYYDKAAALGDGKAREAAERLRQKNPVLRRDARGQDGAALSLPDYKGIFQRVLTKPGAVLVPAPDPSANGRQLATFSRLYVFEKKPGWLKVGEVLGSGGEGWVREDQVQPWSVMLAMRFTPQGSRAPVLFFRDEIALKSVLGAPDANDQVAALVQSAQSGTPDPRLVAIENKAIDWGSSPYVMPILRTSEMKTYEGRLVHLAEVGSVAGLATGSAQGNGCAETSVQALIHQVVFVIDTTESMDPYIEGVRRIADAWRTEVRRAGIENQMRFGVVAFRNNAGGRDE